MRDNTRDCRRSIKLFQTGNSSKFIINHHSGKGERGRGGEGDRGSEGKIEQRIRGKRLSDRVQEGKEESE